VKIESKGSTVSDYVHIWCKYINCSRLLIKDICGTYQHVVDLSNI